MKRYFSAVLRGGLFFVLLAALYFLVGLNFDKTKASSQIFGFGTKGRIAVWVTSAPPAPGVPTVDLKVNGSDSTTVSSGANVDLTWTSANTSSCTGSGFNTGGAAQSSGSGVRVNPTAGTTYTITCGSASDSATVNIGIPGAPAITKTSVSCGDSPAITAQWSAVSGADSYQYRACLGKDCAPSGATNIGNVTSYSFSGTVQGGVTIGSGATYGISIQSRSAGGVSDWSPTIYQAVSCPSAGFSPITSPGQYGKPMTVRWDGQNVSQCKGDVQYGAINFPSHRNSNSLFDTKGAITGSSAVTVSAGTNLNATLNDQTNFALTCTPTNTQLPVFSTRSNDIDLLPADFTLASPSNSCTAGSTASPVSLTWSASDGAIHYEILRAEGTVANPDPTTLVRLNAPEFLNLSFPFTQTAVVDTTAVRNKVYVYIVRALDLKGFTDANRISFTTACVPTARLTASPSAIDLGASATLNWSSGNSNSCTIDKGVGSVCSTGASCDTGGTKSVSPTSDTTYTLTCTGDVLPPAVASATVTLNDQAPTAVAGVSIENASPRTYSTAIRVPRGIPVTVSFAPYTGKFPSTTAISADADTDPAKGILNGGICEWNSDLSFDPSVPSRFDTQIDKTTTIGDGFPFDSLLATKDCVASATHTFNDAGGMYHVYRLTDKQGAKSSVADVTITAVPAPIITSFIATPNPINQDQQFTLSWTSTGAASCSSPDADFNTAIVARTSGSAVISNLRTSPKIYVLNCASTDTGLFPTSATQTVTMTIAPPVCTSFAASPTTTVKPGDPSTLSWNVSNARTCNINQSIGSVAVNSTKTVNPQTTTQYTLTCSGDGTPDCSQSATVSPANQVPSAVAGASLDTASTRTYSNTITVTQGVPAKVYLSAAGSADADGTIKSCQWNSDFNQDPPISFERIISGVSALSDCDTVISSITFPLPSESQSVLGDHTYQILTVTDDKNGVSVPATLHVIILPQLVVSLAASPISGGAPFSPILTATITQYTGVPSDTGNFSLWWDCTNTSSDLGVVKSACGQLPSDPSGDRVCTTNAIGAKCDGVPLQGQEFLSTAVNPAYNVGSFTPKVIVERGGARSAESHTGVTATFPAPTASCAVAPASAITEQNTTWVATASGGSGTYTYVWSGDVPLAGKTGLSAVASYTTAGSKIGSVTVTDTISGLTKIASCGPVVISLPPNGAPVAVAGMSKDTGSSRSYTSSVDVKFGIPTPLYFSAFIGTKASPASGQISIDPDGWTSTEGVSSGGHCDWNVELRQSSPPTYPDAPITSPASATACEASRSNPASSPYTFNDLAQNDAQISRALTYNILQITDNRGIVSNDGQASIVVHYQPTVTLSADKTRINAGDPVVLTWSSTHASSCTGTGFDTGNASSGAKTVNPTSDTTYSVSCSGSTLWAPAVSAPVTVTMNGEYSLTASRDIVVVQGATAGNTNIITVVKLKGSGLSVAFSASGLPQGATATFSPSSCIPGSLPCTSTLTMATTRGIDATPAGTYPVVVTGSVAGTPVVTATFNLIVRSEMSVSLSASPSAVGPAPYVIQLKADAPAVDYTGDPGDSLTYTFWKKCDTAGIDVAVLSAVSACGAPDFVASNVRDLSVRTTDLIYTQQGTYRAKVVAVRKAAVAESHIDITVNPPFNYTLLLDRSRIEMVQGTSITSANRATITNTGGNATAVPLSSRVGNISASMPVPAITFNPTSCTPLQAGSCGSDLSVSVAREMPVGEYPVTVSAGAQNAVFTLAVTGRIDATLSAVPSDRGAAPLQIQLKGDASNYTGSAVDALNYSFWWDCSNITDNPADATAACGNPNDTTIGFKVNSTFQTSVTTPAAHIYATEGVYFAKVIIERGGARKEARIPITVGTPKVSVTCSVSPTSAVINQPVTWTAVPAQGVAPYGFIWTKNVSCDLNPDKCASVSMQYTSAGDKFGSVSVTDKNNDTASRLCDNSLKVFQPTLVITPAATQLHADGEIAQLAAKYDPDGPGGPLPEADVTINASWSVPLSDQNKATVSSAGLVTSKSATGNVTVSASYKDPFNNVIVATAAIAVISRDALICDPAVQTVRTGEQTFPMKASGGIGSYDWLVREIDAMPRTGSTVGNQTFATTFSTIGSKIVNITSGSQSGSCAVTVTDQNLSVNLSAFPTSVVVPQTTRLTAVVSGDALGTMNYSFWWDCGSDKDVDNTTRVETAEGRCGVLPHGVAAGQCQENEFGSSCAGFSATSKAIDHAYATAGAAKPKVIVERGNAAPAQAKADVTIDAANRAPIAIAGISANQNANRAYAKSIVVTQNVPTVIFFGAVTGTANAPDETSSDPDGWANALNGMSHPQNLTATGQCAWNADLDRAAQVSFEDVSGTNRNPASAVDCVTSFVHNFAETGSFTYAVLRMTDNRGAVSAPALVTIDVVAPGAPIAIAGVSSDPSANRIYRDTVSIKQGEDTQLWVSAQRRVGSIDTVSSDPDGWTSKNGGVSKGGSCKWNRDLDRGVFPTGIPTYEWVINDPMDPTEDCDTRIVNEQATSFTRVFTDASGTYAYEALRIFDNTGARSNKALISVQVLPSAAPVALASASTDNGATFHSDIIVTRGATTSIIFSALGSSDPDGWTNPVNGVSTSGQCDWNNTLLQGTSVAFPDVILHPASPAACTLAAQTFIFNDRPGVIDYQLLKIADNKNIQSGIASISVRVTAPDLVVSEGPLPSTSAPLVEKGNVAFTGKIKNQGDAATPATFHASFKIDLGNDGSNDLTIAPDPVIAGLAVGAERSVVSGVWSNLPAGTHKITLCADQPNPAVSNEFFTENNCSSQIITVLPDNRSPVAEAGISLDGVTYGASITVLKGAPVKVWLSADKDVTGDTVASFDPDGWADAARGVAQGGKCDWNLDFASQFAVQNTVNNPASPTICNRNSLDKTFNDPAGTYVYPVLRITDAKLGQSGVAQVSVKVVDSLTDLTHVDCVANVCTVAPGAGANVCAVPGGACTGGSGGGQSGSNLPDLVVSQAPALASGELKAGRTITFSGRIKNQGVGAVTHSFTTAFLIDIGNNGTIDAKIPVSSGVARTSARPELAALPFSDITLPLPASVAELAAGADAPVTSGEWRTVPEGTHRIIVCADSDNTVTESDEINNCSATVMTVGPVNPPAGPLHINSCKASVPEARAGELVDWSAQVSGGNSANSFSWSGDAPLEGTTANPVSVAYQTIGTKSGSVIVTSGNETASRSCGTVNITPGILEFRANPTRINPGQSSVLSWNTTGFASCAITADQSGQSIGSVDTSGTKSVQPPTDTRYTLTCSGASQSQSVTIIVSSVPIIHEVVPH